MACKSAGEVFQSPEAQAGAAFFGTGTGLPIVPLLAASRSIDPKDPLGAGKIAREQNKKFEDALEKAKNLQTTSATDSTTTTRGTTSRTSQTIFDAAGGTEQALRDASIANFAAQNRLVEDQERAIAERSGVQTGARDALGNILSGQAFELSGGEQARIDRLRQSDIDVGSNAVNALLTERLGDLQADAARRGVRGQAFSQLQTGALSEAAKSLERTTLEANRQAAQNAIALPGQRVGIQAGTAGQFASFQDQLAQQAFQNRGQLQDPVALQQLLDERLRGGKTTTTGTTDQTASTQGLTTQTGLGQEAILAAQAGAPGEKATKAAANLGALKTAIDIGGAVAPMV